MKEKLHIFFLISCLWNISVFAQDNSPIQFIENKGQWDPKVKYMGQVGGGAFFVHQDGFTVLQHDPSAMERLHEQRHAKKHVSKDKENTKDKEPFTLRSHAYRMKFVGANPSPRIIADKQLITYNNYYIGNDPSKWASECRTYQGITVKDIYPNVDIRYYSDKGTLKYDLIVNPGGRVSDIALKYDGADKLEIRSRQLIVKTSVGELKELEPYSYQHRETGKEDVAVKYILKGDVVRFDARNYDQNTTLVIDPSIIFCSFTGSPANNWGFTATYGPGGTMFGGGIVFADGFPVSPGAFQTSFGGGTSGAWGPMDIGIMKLSADGSTPLYATYIGGNGNEMPQSLIVNPQGELIIAGRTTSGNYPTTLPMEGPGGNYDIILTKLTATGAMAASRKIGGSADDGANISQYGSGGALSLEQNYGDESRSEVNIDGAGNIYLASCTRSVNFPVTNAFQTNIGGGQDGVVLKLSPDLSTVFLSSYFGGGGNDAAYVLTLHPSTNEIYIAGGTESSALPGSSANTVGPNYNGSIDGFVAIISNGSYTPTKTAYIGTAAIDQVYGIQFDNKGFPYVMGQTSGKWPVLNAAWSQPNSGQFIAKLQPDFSAYVYSTVFGQGFGRPDISPVAFLVDRCENVYISGWGGPLNVSYPTNGALTSMPVTPDAFKPSSDGGDFYFFVLKKDATAQLFGSYFGGSSAIGTADHVDGGTSRFDRSGVIYQAICANCGGGVFPTTAGVWAPNKPGSAYCNLAMLKINLDLSGVTGQVQPSINGVPRDTSGCLPLTVDFADVDPNRTASSYEWDFGDGTATVKNWPRDTISHVYTTAGTFRVMMVAIDPTKCFTRDTTYTNIKVSDIKATLNFTEIKLLPCETFSYSFQNLSTATPAGRTFSSTSFVWDFGDGTKLLAGLHTVTHSYAAPGTYKVRLTLTDTAFCNNVSFVEKTLQVASFVKADFETPAMGCAPYAAVFTNTSVATTSASYQWNFGDGNTSTQRQPTHTYLSPGTYTITLVVTDANTCNVTDQKQFTISVYGKPTAAFTHTTPQLNTPVTFTNNSGSDAIRFRWDFGDGDSLVTTSRNDVKHEYNKTGTYQACLTAYNQYGCADVVCSTLSITVEPAVDVPNAFTPGRNDVNSIVYVKGYGIEKMRFTVWSRWGEKVFETEDKKIGWDGTYKGKLLPMDVYAFTLDVEFVDGTKTRKKGDITLIR